MTIAAFITTLEEDGPAPAAPALPALRYDQACALLAQARTVDEAKDIGDKAEALRVYARQAKNKSLEIDAAEIRIRAERRIGQLITVAKAAGQIVEGRPKAKPENGSSEAPFPRVTLADAGIDKKLSARAQELARMDGPVFDATLAGWRMQAERESERVTTRLVRGEDKKARRDAREAELAGRQMALPEKRYGVILADPEWRFEPRSRETGMDRAADNHYPTSGTEDIMARPVADIAADDCVLFLWATAPMLPDALAVMVAWGFAYRTHCIWRKDRLGTGYWFRNLHELLLVGVRGEIPAPAPGTQWSSVIDAPVGEHSAKPERFHELIESYYPLLPKIELNARALRPGWDAWGLDAPPAEVTG